MARRAMPGLACLANSHAQAGGGRETASCWADLPEEARTQGGGGVHTGGPSDTAPRAAPYSKPPSPPHSPRRLRPPPPHGRKLASDAAGLASCCKNSFAGRCCVEGRRMCTPPKRPPTPEQGRPGGQPAGGTPRPCSTLWARPSGSPRSRSWRCDCCCCCWVDRHYCCCWRLLSESTSAASSASSASVISSTRFFITASSYASSCFTYVICFVATRNR